MLTAAIRRRVRKPLIMEDERDIRENIVRYDDEGGGEEDTEAFDMLALRNPNKPVQSHWKQDQNSAELLMTDKNRLFQEFIRDKLQAADLDLAGPPFDSLQTYAFEGSGSTIDSLSSLNSSSLVESEQSYDFLREWGPRFRKLADLYGNCEGGADDHSRVL